MKQEIKPQVGPRLRTFRERHGWSLRALAERCGLSVNAISRIERGENSPTVSSLQRLATALAVPITDFFIDKPQKAAIYVKNGDGQRVRNDGFVAEHLGFGLPAQQLEPFLLKIDPKCESSANPVDHPGEEFVHCLMGEIEYCINDQIFPLTPGDSILFEAKQPHYWRNHSILPAILLVVFQAAHDNSLARQRHQTG